MAQDLTKSDVHRQNVLNNRFALEKMENELSIGGIRFKGEPVFTKAQIATIFKVEERTIDNYLKEHNEELTKNGYTILRSRELNDFKHLADVDETNFVDINPKVPQLGIFGFKSFLNLSMLLTESDVARQIRSRILDIAIQVIADKVEDRAFVNKRDENYLPAAFWEEKYRADFIDALKKYVKGNQWKYKHCADAMYKSIFKERAVEYRKILNLEDGQDVRDTFYADLLNLIASFEAGIPEILEKAFEEKGKELTVKEAMDLIEDFGNKPLFKPLIQDIRTKIATRDYNLRDAIHDKLEAYIQAMPEADYETFLGEKSKALEEHIKDSIDVFKRLKDR
jgi:hypothetical protein